MPSEAPPPPPPPEPPGASTAADAAGVTTGTSPHTPPPGEDGGPPPVPTSAGFAEPRALHPASVVLGIPLRQLVQGLIVPALIGVSAAPGLRFATLLIVIILTATFVSRFLHWQRFRFSFDGEMFRVDEGVLSRNHRALDVARIQQVEVEHGAVSRLFGLATLRVETAGTSTDIEVELRVLPERDAEALRAAVRTSKAALTGAAPPTATPGDHDAASASEPIIAVGTGRVVAAAITGSRLLVLPAVLAAATQFVGGSDDSGVVSIEALIGGLLALGLWAVIALLIPASLVAATVTGVLRDHGWTMHRRGDDLHVSRGLLSSRESVLPLHRVQLIEVRRNWLRRALGVASLRIHSAGGSGGDERKVTVPLLRDAEVDPLVTAVIPGVSGIPTLTAHPPQARRRAVFRWVRDALIVAVPLWLIPPVPDQVRYAAAAWVVLSVGLGIVEHRQLATGHSDRVVASRRGALSITTQVAPLVKVQGVSTSANWFQRRLGLATVRAHVAGPGGDLTALDLGRDAARELHAHLVVAAADPVVPEALAGAEELTGAKGAAAPADPTDDGGDPVR